MHTDFPHFRYLDTPEHREVFESSHSVVLALFASVARLKENHDKRLEALRLMIPFYTSSLISVSSKSLEY
jgi:hypothetical protein